MCPKVLAQAEVRLRLSFDASSECSKTQFLHARARLTRCRAHRLRNPDTGGRLRADYGAFRRPTARQKEPRAAPAGLHDFLARHQTLEGMAMDPVHALNIRTLCALEFAASSSGRAAMVDVYSYSPREVKRASQDTVTR